MTVARPRGEPNVDPIQDLDLARKRYRSILK
jgi:hypothetical protein